MGILLLGVLGVLVWCILWHSPREAPEGDEGALIAETASVTADFLEAGQVAALLSGGSYLGTISVRRQKRKYNQIGFCITMYDTGNLELSYEAYRQSHPQLSREDFHVLEQFLEKYGGGYDRERNGLVYTTKASARPSEALEGELRNRIALHPLAELEEIGCIHTKYVGKL